MAGRLAFVSWLALLALALSPLAHAEEETADPPLQFYDITSHFLEFWDDTTSLDRDARTQRFIADVASPFPAYYSRYTASEAGRGQIQGALEEFADIRADYIAKAEAFEKNLASNAASFRAAFPEFEITVPIVLMHSLGEFDGRATVLRGQQFLLFGADGMARLHDYEDENAFFHHELFHILHFDAFTTCGTVWCRMWPEGLAASAAHALNPQAGHDELLLDLPKGTVEATLSQLAASLQEVRANLDSRDPDLIASLFALRPQGDGMPQRRGYYIGYLIAEEATREQDHAALAALSNEAARPVFEKALDRLIAAAGEDAGPD